MWKNPNTGDLTELSRVPPRSVVTQNSYRGHKFLLQGRTRRTSVDVWGEGACSAGEFDPQDAACSDPREERGLLPPSGDGAAAEWPQEVRDGPRSRGPQWWRSPQPGALLASCSWPCTPGRPRARGRCHAATSTRRNWGLYSPLVVGHGLLAAHEYAASTRRPGVGCHDWGASSTASRTRPEGCGQEEAASRARSVVDDQELAASQYWAPRTVLGAEDCADRGARTILCGEYHM